MGVSWRFDGDDRLCGVGGRWDEFALANDGDACVPPPIGQGLTDFVGSAELCVLWEAIFGFARRTRDRPLKLTYRCDSPTERRIMAAIVTPGAGGEIDIVSPVLQQASRPSVRLLEPSAERGPDLVRMCGWCARVQVDGWVDVEEGCRRLNLLERDDGPLPQITHGVCGDCRDAVAREFGLEDHFSREMPWKSTTDATAGPVTVAR